ncbi:MAG: serine/threonine-protein kinase [Nanoarchaeota archaeon]
METLDELVGKELGEYLIEEKIGEGAFLTVFRGKHKQIDRPVAVKVLNDFSQQERLSREADKLAKVGNHAGIVDVYDADVHANNPYIVVEYCDTSLKSLIEQNGKIGWGIAADYTRQMLEALDFIHKNGEVHGDLKPSNVLLRDNCIKLSDFNTQTIGDPEAYARSMLQSASLMHQGKQPKFTEGSVLYFTPEHRNGKDITRKSDIHQTGQILYEMITGTRFIDREGEASKTGSPKWLDDVIDKATNNNPEKRYHYALDMRSEIQKGIEGKFDVSAGHTVISRIGRAIGLTAKYAGLTVSAPFWFPSWLYRSAEKDTAGSGPLGLFLCGLLYGAGGLLGGVIIDECYFEPKTRAAAKAEFERASPDVHLAYTHYTNLKLVSISKVLDENPPITEIVLPIHPVKSVLGIYENNLFYTGEEILPYGLMSVDRRYPQIYSVSLSDGSCKGLVNNSMDENVWTADKEFEEAHIIKESREPIVKIDGAWYNVGDNGHLLRASRVSLPFEEPSRIVPGTDYRFSTDFYGGEIQFSQGEEFWGDVELFEGNNPMIVRYTPKK